MEQQGVWRATGAPPGFASAELLAAVQRPRDVVHVVSDPTQGRLGLAFEGMTNGNGDGPDSTGFPLVATLAPVYPEWLGDRSFLEVHRVRFPYVAGAMANGIASPRLVQAMGEAGMLAFLRSRRPDSGSGRGCGRRAVALAGGIVSPGAPTSFTSPNEPGIEEAVAALYIERGVSRVSASAFMNLTPAVVRYAYAGVTRDPAGEIRRPRTRVRQDLSLRGGPPLHGARPDRDVAGSGLARLVDRG